MKHFLIPLVTLLAVLCGGVAWAGSASAHADLVSSSPQDGDVLDAPPTELVFTFNEPLLPDFVRFIATSPDGQTGDLIITGVDGPTATITWPAGAAAGVAASAMCFFVCVSRARSMCVCAVVTLAGHGSPGRVLDKPLVAHAGAGGASRSVGARVFLRGRMDK